MSIKLSKNNLYFKNKVTNNLTPIGVIASGATESLAQIKEYSDNQLSEFKEKTSITFITDEEIDTLF